uniref:Uiu8(Geb) n=1 Tax=Arundo donax TaxID=35708 RepID=A0A0A9AZ51_ARUDO
MSICASFSV